MAPRPREQAQDQAVGHQDAAADNGNASGDDFSRFVASIGQGDVVLYVHKNGVGDTGYLGQLKFNPAAHNIGMLYGAIAHKWGPGQYLLKTQARGGSGFGPGSLRLEIADVPTAAPVPPVAAPAPYYAPPYGPQVPPAQYPAQDNRGMLELLRELLHRTQSDPHAIQEVLKAALAGQREVFQSAAASRDPGQQGLQLAREILRLTREGRDDSPTSGGGGDGDMMPMMMMMMMQGGGGLERMMPLMMMMQNGGKKSEMWPLMMMMMDRPRRPPPSRPAPSPWGPMEPYPAAAAEEPRDTGEMMRMLRMFQALQRRDTPASPPPASPPPPAPPPPAPPATSSANGPKLDLDFAGFADMFNVDPEVLEAELADMEPEQRQAINLLMGGGK